MHRFPSFSSNFLTAAIFIGFYVSTPSIELEDKTPENVFSLKNALENVKQSLKNLTPQVFQLIKMFKNT
ncbi:hypothetical protein Q2T40_03915 [Winogradskyella maritima]|nr:hypothetical protein [Winogradskyella maritima]